MKSLFYRRKPMNLSKEQKSLILAIRKQQSFRVRAMLLLGIDLNFPAVRGMTPLHEAVRTDNLSIVKMLVNADADINARADDGATALDMAKDMARGQAGSAIVRYLRNAGAKTEAELRVSLPKKPLFTAASLPVIFAPVKWVDNVRDMQELWKQVPPNLQAKFNFAAALTETRQRTLKRRALKKFTLPKPPSPPPAA